MIEARLLSKNYGSHRAVDGVSFDVGRGEIVGLLGPNGSGKTTIMRMLTGFFAPTSGSCKIAGVDVGGEPRRARALLGYLPERVALYPDMTVRRYLAFVARVHGVTGRLRSHIDEAVERCGLQAVVDRQIGRLSRGYRQRVGVAQAVIHRPAVLVLDEPTVGLDPRQIVEIRALIRDLAGQSTVLLSTHILPEVSVTCGRVLILDGGRLIAEESAEGLRDRSAAGARLRIRARAPRAEAAAAIAALPGIEDVVVESAAGDGVLDLSAATDGAVARADAVARCVVEHGWRLDEVAPVLPSLEELFVEILDCARDGEGGER